MNKLLTSLDKSWKLRSSNLIVTSLSLISYKRINNDLSNL